LEVDPLS